MTNTKICYIIYFQTSLIKDVITEKRFTITTTIIQCKPKILTIRLNAWNNPWPLPPSLSPIGFVNFYILKIVKAGFFISEELLYIYLVLIPIFVFNSLFFSWNVSMKDNENLECFYVHLENLTLFCVYIIQAFFQYLLFDDDIRKRSRQSTFFMIINVCST